MIKAMSVMMTIMVFALPAMAQEAATGNYKGTKGAVFGSLAVGIAAAGAALGDSRAVAAACEGTARNPGAGGRIFTSMMLGLVLIETLVLVTFAAAFLGL
ncbi:MAG: ATP synthase F0 subunit C [Blastocatellia bacterium]|nr:ATP synthase F0 subunit C [Blastocatellia bacterium]